MKKGRKAARAQANALYEEKGLPIPEPAVPFRRTEPKQQPNLPCHCASGRKHKYCCGS